MNRFPFSRARYAQLWWIAVVLGAAPATALAQTDEIQVYDAEIADVGKFNMMIHDNFTPDGLKTPAFPGAVEYDHALFGVAEWAYGVAPWFEQGLYLPLYSFSQNDGATFNGFKLRELFVKPHAEDQKFFYGVEFRVQRQPETMGSRGTIHPRLGRSSDGA